MQLSAEMIQEAQTSGSDRCPAMMSSSRMLSTLPESVKSSSTTGNRLERKKIKNIIIIINNIIIIHTKSAVPFSMFPIIFAVHIAFPCAHVVCISTDGVDFSIM